MIRERIEKRIGFLKEFLKDLKEPHKIKNLGDGIFALREGVFSYCFLITGEKKALIIDGGIGVPGIREKIGTVTGLPVIPVLTGASPWTAGSSGEFKCTYVSSKDLFLARISNLPLLRKALYTVDVFRILSGNGTLLTEKKGDFRSLEKEFPLEKDSERVIDLGSRKVYFSSIPGATKGGTAFRDGLTGKVFCGSAAGPLMILFPVVSATAKEYYESVKAIRKAAGENSVYSRYAARPVMKTGIDEMESLMHSEANRGNSRDTSEPFRFVSSDRHIRFLLHFPARTERKPFKKKLREISGF